MLTLSGCPPFGAVKAVVVESKKEKLESAKVQFSAYAATAKQACKQRSEARRSERGGEGAEVVCVSVKRSSAREELTVMLSLPEISPVLCVPLPGKQAKRKERAARRDCKLVCVCSGRKVAAAAWGGKDGETRLQISSCLEHCTSSHTRTGQRKRALGASKRAAIATAPLVRACQPPSTASG